LVVERAEGRICFQVEELINQWRRTSPLGKPVPDSLEFMKRIIDEGFYLPTFSKVINYLDECKAKSTAPDGKSLFKKLLPWSSYPVWE